MRQIDQALAALSRLFGDIVGIVLSGMAMIENWLRALMAPLGLTSQVQTVVLLFVLVVLAVLFIRVFAGLIRGLLVVFLILLTLHIVLPALHR